MQWSLVHSVIYTLAFGCIWCQGRCGLLQQSSCSERSSFTFWRWSHWSSQCHPQQMQFCRQQLRLWRLKPIVSARWLRWDGLGRLCQASQSGAAMIRFYSPQIQNHTNKIKKQYNYPICSCSVQSYAVCRCQAMLAAMSWIIPMCWSTKLVAGYHGWIPMSYAIEI